MFPSLDEFKRGILAGQCWELKSALVKPAKLVNECIRAIIIIQICFGVCVSVCVSFIAICNIVPFLHIKHQGRNRDQLWEIIMGWIGSCSVAGG